MAEHFLTKINFFFSTWDNKRVYFRFGYLRLASMAIFLSESLIPFRNVFMANHFSRLFSVSVFKKADRRPNVNGSSNQILWPDLSMTWNVCLFSHQPFSSFDFSCERSNCMCSIGGCMAFPWLMSFSWRVFDLYKIHIVKKKQRGERES